MSKTLEKKFCKFCGIEFVTTNSRQIFCSQSCCVNFHRRKNHPIEKKVCPVCGMEFLANDKRQIFCSKSCRDKDWWKKHDYTKKRTERRRQNRPPLEKRLCKFCGIEFAPRRPDQIYCSVQCNVKFNSRKSRLERD